MPSLLRSPLLLLLAATLLAGCTGKSRHDEARADARGDSAVEEFRGPPTVSPEMHYAAGQLIESRTVTPLPNGRMPNDDQIAGYRAAAIDQYRKALKLQSNHTPSLYRIAVLQTEARQYDQAVATWQRYVEATGRTASSLVNLGLGLEMAGRPQQAEHAYIEATRADPKHIAAHVNLGMLLAKQGKLQPATNALSTVLSPAATHWHLGAALQAAGKMKEADQQFRTAAALDPHYATRPTLPQAATARIE